MGRFTVFAVEDCAHCQRTKAAMKERNIPYTEVSLTTHPQRRVDMLSLSDKMTVPQVFLNETLIGGAQETLKLLQQWDSIPHAYQSFCERADEPKDPRLAPMVGPGVVEPPPPPRQEQDQAVPLPNIDQPATPQLFTSVLKMTELLKKILPREDLKYNMTTYRNSFRAKDAVSALMNQYQLSESQAVHYGKILQKLLIFDHVVGEHDFENTGMYFRLRCDQTPNVLNSYRGSWTERVDPNSLGLLKRLKSMLDKIESAHTDIKGKVDYKAARSHPDLCVFEEAVCELQKVPYSRLQHEIKLAFSINLYHLMIKYAYIKVGISTSDTSRLGFYNNITFQLGPDHFSFHDLEHGILRANRKAPFALSHPFGPKDDRWRLSMPTVDCRILFALHFGIKSSQPVNNFTDVGIDQELRIVAQDFCQEDAQVEIKEREMTVQLSEIFKWHREDFCSPTADTLPKAVVKYLRGNKKSALERMLLRGPSSSVKVKFLPYHWSTNASDFVPFTGGSVKANSSRFL